MTMMIDWTPLNTRWITKQGSSRPVRARTTVKTTLSRVIEPITPAFGQYCKTCSPANITETITTVAH